MSEAAAMTVNVTCSAVGASVGDAVAAVIGATVAAACGEHATPSNIISNKAIERTFECISFPFFRFLSWIRSNNASIIVSFLFYWLSLPPY